MTLRVAGHNRPNAVYAAGKRFRKAVHKTIGSRPSFANCCRRDGDDASMEPGAPADATEAKRG